MKWQNNLKRKSRHFLAVKTESVAGRQSLKFFKQIILPKNSLAIYQEDFSRRDLSAICD
jgi:hypothetical protein